ncbi:SRPBCC family protein [Rhizobium bangladeshense]|uniref:SRPBCC family protein n=1 Tax=Rhizobium bangladeshense TaxID=1138189 RepID=UPI0007E5ACCC|nr:SRPBCC domain-containing protein [Rhizobium bangladeshense]
MLAANTIKCRVSHTYKASPAVVYDAWLNPEIARRFLFATNDGHVIRADIDPRVGGRFFIVDRRPTGDAFHQGVFLELKRPRHMAFSFTVEEHDHNCDRVEIDIEPLGSGSRLTLTHTMCAEWAEHEEKTRQGWAHVVESLGKELEQQQFKATG